MASKTKKSMWFERYSIPATTAIYSNTLGVGSTDNEVVINFGFLTPSYFEPHDDEDIPVARIVLSWELARDLLDTLSPIVKNYEKKQNTKERKRTKST